MQVLSVIYTDYVTGTSFGPCYILDNKDWIRYQIVNICKLPTVKIQDKLEERVRYIGEKPKIPCETLLFTINLCGDIL